MASFPHDCDDSLRESTLPLKEALTISELSQPSGFTFEVDTKEELGSLDLDFLDGGITGENFYVEEYIGDPHLHSQSILDTIDPDENVGDFDYVLPLMTDLSTDGKVKKLVVREGKTKEVVPYDGKISYHYIAYAEGKEGAIDSTVARGMPYNLAFTTRECLPGLFIALQSMKVGEISKFWFHFDVAYGKMGAPPRIPPSANILCVIEVISAVGKEDLQNVLQMSREERLQIPFDKILATTRDLRAKGNTCYNDGDFKGAILRYHKGIEILENYPVILLGEEESRSDLLGTFYSNIAQAFIKTDQPRKACTACLNGLRIPKYLLRHKILFKFAKAKAMLKDYHDSVGLCKKALACTSLEKKEERVEIEQYMKGIRQYKAVGDQQLQKMYERMVGAKEDKVDGVAE